MNQDDLSLWKFLTERSVGDRPDIPPALAKFAWEVWTGMRGLCNRRLPPPYAGILPDGELLLSWDRGDHHFEAEFPRDCMPVEFFYRNRATDELWGFDWTDEGVELPGEFFDHIRFICEGDNSTSCNTK